MSNLKAKVNKTCFRRKFTVAEKLEFVNELKTTFNNNLSEASKQLGIDRKQLRSWRHDEEALANIDKKRIKMRKKGGGRKPFFPELEKELYAWFVNERKVNKNIVNYRRLREEAEKLATKYDLTKNKFKISNNWIYTFSKRHKLSMRKITHVGQEDSSTPAEKRIVAEDFLTTCQIITCNYDSENIFNMDETPVYIDMTSNQTLSLEGKFLSLKESLFTMYKIYFCLRRKNH